MTLNLCKRLVTILAFSSLPFVACAAEVSVAVAANFTAPIKRIAELFERDTGHKARLAFGATGQLYAKIKHGAPFDVLLSADDKTPAKLAQEGLAVEGTAFTYATGQLVLWSSTPGLIDDGEAMLTSGKFNRITIANPKLAPYGAAAMQVVKKLGVTAAITPKIVEGSTIGQTFHFVSSGNAPLGFIALSQVFVDGKITKGSGWIVPLSLHDPIKQEAITLTRGKDNPAAEAFTTYLRSERAKAIMQSFGYTL